MFTDPAGFSGTGNLDATGVAVLATTALPAGTHTITAGYAGDATHGASSSAAAVAVDMIATNLTLASSSNPSKAGDSVTLTASVKPALGAGIPTGAVTFALAGDSTTIPSTLQAQRVSTRRWGTNSATTGKASIAIPLN